MPCLVRSPHAHAVDHADRYGGGDRRAGGARGADRQRCRSRRPAPDPAQPGTDQPARGAAAAAATAPAFFIAPHPVLARRRRPLCRRTGGGGRRGNPRRRRRTPPNASMSSTEPLRCCSPVGGCAGAAERRRSGQQHGSNLCIDFEAGDAEATEAAFARAAYVVRLQTTINRVTGVPMELRAALGVYDEASGAIHRLYQRRRRGDPAAGRHCRSARGREGRGARGLRRCRRQFRDPQQHLPGIRAGRLGRETRRPSGQMDVRAARCLSDRFPRPRPDVGSRARARRVRQLPRPARDQHQQSRGQRDFLCAAGQGDRGLVQRLSHPGRRICAASASSPTLPRPRPIGAPAARRSCSSSSG